MKDKVIKGYKVFNYDWTCRNKQYNCPGQFEEDVEPTTDGYGMHFCKKLINCFNYYRFDSTTSKVAEVVAYGTVVEEGEKCYTNKLRIIREVPWEEVLTIVNTGRHCSGISNTGDNNFSNYNTGDFNSGEWNSGDCNYGDFNSGNHNGGEWNSGNYNSGNHNSGSQNFGNFNVGSWNSGSSNVGNYNAGNCNVGDWNTGDWNAGCFNTETGKLQLFNRPSEWTIDDWLKSDAKKLLDKIPKDSLSWVHESEMTEEEKSGNPEYKITEGYLRVLKRSTERQKWWDGLTNQQKDVIKAIPNFDASIFKVCTGIEV